MHYDVITDDDDAGWRMIIDADNDDLYTSSGNGEATM